MGRFAGRLIIDRVRRGQISQWQDQQYGERKVAQGTTIEHGSSTSVHAGNAGALIGVTNGQ